MELSACDIDSYNRDGYVVVRSVFDLGIVAALRSAAGIGAIGVTDSSGSRQELNAWTDLGDDLLGLVPRSHTVVSLAERLIGEPIYHWHSKISWKMPHTSGTWDWHQDYGFWREEGCDRPAMTTVSVALDPQTPANGCLRVIPGSHNQGDIEHRAVGQGRAADPKTIDGLIDSNGIVDLVLEPGDLIAFHSQTVHGSGPNTTNRMRSILHCSYNALSNDPKSPFFPGHRAGPLDVVDDSHLLPDRWTDVVYDYRLLTAAQNGYANQGYKVVDVTS